MKDVKYQICAFCHLINNIIIRSVRCKTPSCVFHGLPEIGNFGNLEADFSLMGVGAGSFEISQRVIGKSTTYLRGMRAMLPTVLPPGASFSEWKGPDMVSAVNPEVVVGS